MSAAPVLPHRSTAELEAALDLIRAAPADGGRVELVVSRPERHQRVVLGEGALDPVCGLVGDRWLRDPFDRLPDGSPDPNFQLSIIGARVSTAVAGDPARRPLAGDQLHLDLDLSRENLPVGSRLAVGTAVIEVTAGPHLGCGIFLRHYGRDATAFVNNRVGRSLRLRGVRARVVVGGTVRPGDEVAKC